jgi:hypothetical protein
MYSTVKRDSNKGKLKSDDEKCLDQIENGYVDF